MMLLLHWLLSAIALLIVSRFVPGFEVRSFGYALLAVVIIGLLNATIGLLLKLITLPINILTLGVFSVIINAVILLLASKLTPGFAIHGFLPALIGAIALALISMLFHAIASRAAA
ncbi:MAG TPA: phage holin family protein [Acidisarcina sp.]|nr:phage holin family protein [Acidisarcina sp.]